MRVLGVDPGSVRTGWGCVELGPEGPVRIASGVLELGRGPLTDRLLRLESGLDRVFAQHRPEACATEGLFQQRNARSALLLGHARGVCLLVAARHGVPVTEYAPASVKRAIAGHGAADKQQVSEMVAGQLGFEPGMRHDETDALAIAICHLEAERPLRLTE